MSIYKHDGDAGPYWFGFTFRGKRVQESTHQHNRNVAISMQAECRARLVREFEERQRQAKKLNCDPNQLRACSECATMFNAGKNPITSPNEEHVFCSELCEQRWCSRQSPTPSFLAFGERFEAEMKSVHAAKPKTLTYYLNGLIALRAFFGEMRLDRIEEEQIAAFVAKRRAMKKRNGKPLKVATVNRELEVLRRMLRLAQEWKVINRVPKISRQPGEVGRERVLTHAEEQSYLAVAEQPLRDIATTMIDTALRPEEAFRVQWQNVHFEPAGNAQFGYIFNPFGKTKYARRNVSMTRRVRALLEMRHTEQGRPSEGWVFPAKTKSGHVNEVKSQHKKALKDSGLALVKGSRLEPIVLYSLRHTMLTRLGESGADSFSIQKIAGHSSILVSEKYVHPTPEKIEAAFTQLEAYNAKKEEQLKEEQDRQRVQ